MQVLIAVMGGLVTLLVATGMMLMTPRNIEKVVHTEDGIVTAPDDGESPG